MSDDNFFARIGEEAKEAGEKVAAGFKDLTGQVVKKGASLQKGAHLSSQKNAKLKELDEDYIKLGRLAYQKGGLTGDMADVAAQIKKTYGELQDIELQINEN